MTARLPPIPVGDIAVMRAILAMTGRIAEKYLATGFAFDGHGVSRIQNAVDIIPRIAAGIRAETAARPPPVGRKRSATLRAGRIWRYNLYAHAAAA